MALQEHHNLTAFRVGIPDDVPTGSTSTAVAPESTSALAREKTRSTYQPTSGNDPYGLQKASHDKKRQLVLEEFESLWPPPEKSLLGKFFPTPQSAEAALSELGDEYGPVSRRSSVNHGRRKVLSQGWTKMPSPPKPDESAISEKDITRAFVPIVNRIIAFLGLSDTRVAVDRQNFPIPTRDGGTLKPDVFLWGKGSPAFPPVDGVPPAQTVSKGEATRRGLATGDEGPPVDWRWCVCPIEVKTEKARGSEEKATSDVYSQLGTYVREIFAAQENRRFVPSLVLTECTVEFLIWDRAGVVVSERIDYHESIEGITPSDTLTKKPKKSAKLKAREPRDNHLLFCHMMVTILTWDDSQLGFDPTVFYKAGDPHLHILSTRDLENNVREEVEYVVVETLFRPYTIRGRGSTCWRVRKLDDDGTCYTVLDSWVKDGKGAEGVFLRTIEEIREKGLLTGVAPLINIEDVLITGPTFSPDSIKHNRGGDLFTAKEDLVHTRTTLSCDGNLLEACTSIEDLLRALHDVIKAHGQLYLEARIVHRYIVPWNILAQPMAPEGFRGILIDYSCATSNSDKEFIPRRSEITPGAHLFRSRDSLDPEGNAASSHLNELESFYWILCFIIVGHQGPNFAASRLAQTPEVLLQWLKDAEDAAMHKQGHLSQPFNLPVRTGSWGPVEQLARNLHRFFQSRIEARQHALSIKQVPEPSKPVEDYDEFVGRFAEALRMLDSPLLGTDMPQGELERSLDAFVKRSLDEFDPKAPLPPPKRSCLRMMFELQSPEGDLSRLGNVGASFIDVDIEHVRGAEPRRDSEIPLTDASEVNGESTSEDDSVSDGGSVMDGDSVGGA